MQFLKDNTFYCLYIIFSNMFDPSAGPITGIRTTVVKKNHRNCHPLSGALERYNREKVAPK